MSKSFVATKVIEAYLKAREVKYRIYPDDYYGKECFKILIDGYGKMELYFNSISIINLKDEKIDVTFIMGERGIDYDELFQYLIHQEITENMMKGIAKIVEDINDDDGKSKDDIQLFMKFFYRNIDAFGLDEKEIDVFKSMFEKH